MIKKIALGVAALVVLGAALGLYGIWHIGAWNLVFENRTHETEPPALPDALARPAVLLFTKTNGFRHKEALAAGVPFLEAIAERRGWSLFHTENGAVMNDEQLARFDAIVFFQTSGDTLDEAQEAAFERFLRSGGGWFGVHAAGDGSHADWTWYVDTLIGTPYIAHILNPQFQTARVVVEDANHPATRDLPSEWMHEEEWYSWERSPRGAGMHVLASVDERTYSPEIAIAGREKDLRMGDDHPMVWTSCVGRGRTIYAGFGHQAEAYETDTFRALFEGAIAWAARVEGDGCS